MFFILLFPILSLFVCCKRHLVLQIHRINTKYNVLYLHGECPGEKGGFIVISDAWKKHERPPPFPTYFPDPDNPLPEDLYADNIQRFEETIYYSKNKKSEKA